MKICPAVRGYAPFGRILCIGVGGIYCIDILTIHLNSDIILITIVFYGRGLKEERRI